MAYGVRRTLDARNLDSSCYIDLVSEHLSSVT